MTFNRRPQSYRESKENIPETWKIDGYSQMNSVEEVGGPSSKWKRVFKDSW